MNILVTGAAGFIGKNLVLRLSELSQFDVTTFVREDSIYDLKERLADADIVVHLAGENRPLNKQCFEKGNSVLTSQICDLIREQNRNIPIIMASSTQAELNNFYGKSKLAAEKSIEVLCGDTNNAAVIYRLPGVFGKWCKPNYNSVVATFCNNIALGLPIQINDPSSLLTLVYIDDVIASFLEVLQRPMLKGVVRNSIESVYSVTLGDLSKQISKFKNCRTSLISERVGCGFLRALYSTYVSYLPKEQFKYSLTSHQDERGTFVEMLKTKDSGQFSFFTALPGVTRGGHYHHTKTEKFLVIKGNARFGFRHILTEDSFSIESSGKSPSIVETVPGWTHDITNIGDDELIVMLWANENFDVSQPDTISSRV